MLSYFFYSVFRYTNTLTLSTVISCDHIIAQGLGYRRIEKRKNESDMFHYLFECYELLYHY